MGFVWGGEPVEMMNFCWDAVALVNTRLVGLKKKSLSTHLSCFKQSIGRILVVHQQRCLLLQTSELTGSAQGTTDKTISRQDYDSWVS